MRDIKSENTYGPGRRRRCWLSGWLGGVRKGGIKLGGGGSTSQSSSRGRVPAT